MSQKDTSFEQLQQENIRLKEKTKKLKSRLSTALRELGQRNRQLEEKHQELKDSINYAERIQHAILPPDYFIKKYLPDSFILYKPKDVVSGDFYYLSPCYSPKERGEKVLPFGDDSGGVIFAAVDCTGHGVPGALMSVVGFNFINQAVTEEGLSKPSDILSFLDQGVNEILRQTAGESGVNDGMDLALCNLSPNPSPKERGEKPSWTLQYAGVFNPLYIVSSSMSHVSRQLGGPILKHETLNTGLFEVKADKAPIGVNIDGVADEYTNHVIQLEKGDTIYLFSDGYADQFGGPKGKKFKYKPLKELLISIHDKSMEEQHQILDETIERWRGDLPQVDDIVIMGVRV